MKTTGKGSLRSGVMMGLCVLMGGAAGAQPGQSDPANTSAERKAAQKDPVISGKEDSADKQFLSMAIQGNLAEIQMANMALKKSRNNNIVNYARRIIEDHTANNNQAMQIAKKKGITVPKMPGADAMAMMKRMSGMKSNFNKMYISDQIKDHKKDIAMYSKEGKTGYDGDIKAYALTTLPTLQSHLQTAQTLMNPTQGSITPANTRKDPTSRPNGSTVK